MYNLTCKNNKSMETRHSEKTVSLCGDNQSLLMVLVSLPLCVFQILGSEKVLNQSQYVDL